MKLNMKSGGRIVIDGRSFNGTSVSIQNGKVTVDGVLQDGELVGDVNIEDHGDVTTLENSAGKVVAKSVGSVQTQSGDVECGDVSGSVKSMSGDIRCGEISGSVSTMSGDIHNA